MVGTAADACRPVAPTRSGVERGRQCADSYFSPERTVFSGPAERISATTVRQKITSGRCEGEQIVVYYDCAREQAVWMGGEYSVMGFFSPDHSVTAISGRLQGLGWMPQSGTVNSSAITVDGKRFNLACGCDLPQMGGN
ncbi:hypothetical protein [Paracoccus sp. S1E-3]|uniref:hypothetical protein n=1 Tax=Paracoccus sp. S1E-3 TaxID=2756130 RepID=UPI0015EEAC04|nr:hypothetical protein [Paracoccus sp. S1E-3]MBA4491986.1 hypothetical protein [Paracoccus sp. S1E-3]